MAKNSRKCRRYYGSFLWFAGRGEMVPNDDCYCEIDPEVKDKWGIRCAVQLKWAGHETRQAAHMQKPSPRSLNRWAASVTKPEFDVRKAIAPGGRSSMKSAHVHGRPEEKVRINQYCQSWDVKNLFVTDGGPFRPTRQKPPLSIMALAWRSKRIPGRTIEEGEHLKPSPTMNENEPKRMDRVKP